MLWPSAQWGRRVCRCHEVGARESQAPRPPGAPRTQRPAWAWPAGPGPQWVGCGLWCGLSAGRSALGSLWLEDHTGPRGHRQDGPVGPSGTVGGRAHHREGQGRLVCLGAAWLAGKPCSSSRPCPLGANLTTFLCPPRVPLAAIVNPKQPKETPKSFSFDYSYWSHTSVSQRWGPACWGVDASQASSQRGPGEPSTS